MTTSVNTELVWQEFSSGLRSFILSKVNDDSLAEDILQDAFIKIHDNLHALNDRAKIKPWIYQITRNLITDYYRSQKHPKAEVAEFSDPLGSQSSEGFMEAAITDMIGMMEKMAPEYCEALCLTEIDGLSQKEYAEKKGISYSGAKSRIQRARLMLRDMLLKCCHYQFDKYGTVIDIQPNCCCCTPGEKYVK